MIYPTFLSQRQPPRKYLGLTRFCISEIDADHSGEITFAEFVNWSLKEAIIADLEYRERMSHNVDLGDTVLLTGEYQGIVGKVISYDRATKTYVIELPDGTRINRKPTDFVNGAATEEVT